LTTEDLTTTFTGSSFESVKGGWDWHFDENGLARSKAYDGAWDNKDQKWSIEDGKLCRAIEDDYPCVHVYKVDEAFVLGKEGTDELETFAIKFM